MPAGYQEPVVAVRVTSTRGVQAMEGFVVDVNEPGAT
ncbi:MAG: hypothetical protein QOJ72_1695, partial [Nocardioidaceae bacterium]|nr:hypothetical protein [Nocardioidaceae bacterium]